MLANNHVPYTEILNLPLDFSREQPMPENLEDFEDIISSEDFKFWFKVYWWNIVPMKSHSISTNYYADVYSVKSIKSNVFKLLKNKELQKVLFVVNNSWEFILYIDKEINNWKAKIDNWIFHLDEVKETISNKILKILSFINKKNRLEKIVDPYITQNILSNLNSLPEFYNRIAAILSIEEASDKFIVKFQKKTVEKDESGNDRFAEYSEEVVEILKEDWEIVFVENK